MRYCTSTRNCPAIPVMWCTANRAHPPSARIVGQHFFQAVGAYTRFGPAQPHLDVWGTPCTGWAGPDWRFDTRLALNPVYDRGGSAWQSWLPLILPRGLRLLPGSLLLPPRLRGWLNRA